jgi:SpoVK/Ycf46/Vps4 family AAA+-type ATPase
MKMSKILKIEEVPNQEWVYDPVCDEPHTFSANGIISHNCVLWIDEVEKSLSGTKSSNFSDGGTLSRVFGTLLTAMQDGMKGVTMIATANDITMLPPEFIRRFNEVFFVDLPGPEERWEIFEIHLKKRNRDITLLNKSKSDILQACHDYTGAEIEKAIKDAIAFAFYDEKGDLTAKHVLAALKETKPIAKVMKDKVQKIRDKARGQYRFASSWSENENKLAASVKTASGKKLDIDSAVDDFKEIKSSKQKADEYEQKKVERFSDEDLLGE